MSGERISRASMESEGGEVRHRAGRERIGQAAAGGEEARTYRGIHGKLVGRGKVSEKGGKKRGGRDGGGEEK